MADDQTQSQGGGFLSEIGQGLTKALPYALDAGIGAALGGPMGAVAGLARAGGTTEEQQRQQEIGMHQQELGLQIQQFGLEKQKMLGALQTEQNYQDFVDSQPKEDQAMLRAVPPEARGAVIMDKIQSGEWKNSLGMMDDPEFLKAHNLTAADVSILRNLPPKQGNQLFGEMLKAGQQNNLQAMKYVQQQALEAQREGAAAGRQATSEAAQNARQQKSIDAANARQAKALQEKKDKASKIPSASMLSSLATKAVTDAANTTLGGYGNTTYGAPVEARKAAAMENFRKQLLSANPDMDPDKAQELADRYIGPKYALSSRRNAAVTPAAPAGLPSGYRASGKTTKDGKPVYENTMMPPNKRYWTPD